MTDVPPHVNPDGGRLYAWPTAAEVFRVPPYLVERLERDRRVAWDAPIQEAVIRALRAESAWIEARVISVLASWGECAWTSRDALTITHYPDGRIVVA